MDFDFGGGQSSFVYNIGVFGEAFMFSPSALKLECLQETDFGQYVLQALFFPVTALGFALITVGSRINGSWRVDANSALNTLLTLNQGFLITFATLSLSAFQCFNHFGNVETMYQFPRTRCYVADHTKFLIVSLFMILIVVIPFNCIFMYAVWTLYKLRADATASVQMLVRFKLFFQKWRPDRWYWGYVFVLRQILFACTLLLATDAVSQLVFGIVVLVSYCVVLALLVPWRWFEMNIVEFLFGIMLVFMLVVQIAMMDAVDISKFGKMFEVLLVLLLCFGILYFIRIGVQGILCRRAGFVVYPKLIDEGRLGKCLETLCTTNVSVDVLAELTRNLSEYENRVFESFFCLLEKQSCSNFNFPSGRGFGTRIFVPNVAMLEHHFSSNMRTEFTKSKTNINESYI